MYEINKCMQLLYHATKLYSLLLMPCLLKNKVINVMIPCIENNTNNYD